MSFGLRMMPCSCVSNETRRNRPISSMMVVGVPLQTVPKYHVVGDVIHKSCGVNALIFDPQELLAVPLLLGK